MLYKKITKTLLLTGLMAFASSSVAFAAGDLNEYVADATDNVTNYPQVIAYICYLGGFVLAALGVYGLKQHTENPNNVPLRSPLARLGFGGIFMALPPLVSAMQGTFGGDATAVTPDIPGGGAADGTLGGMIDLIVANTTSLPNLVSYIGYFAGFLLAATGVYKMKNHIEQGPQSVPLSDPLKYLFAGGLIMSLPVLSGVAMETFGDGGADQDTSWDNAGYTGTPGTLDDMMIRVMGNAFDPVTNLFTFFCFVAGAVLMLIAIHRFTKTAQEGPRGPSGIGTVATFVLAGVLFSIAPMIGVFTETLFGTRDSMTSVTFLALDESMGAGTEHAERVAVAILAFLIIVGILSIIRGLFVLRGVAEGNQQMTMMSGISHVVAGAILVNFGQFANIIQTTLGIADYGLQFN